MSMFEVAVAFLGTVGVSVITLAAGALVLEESFRSVRKIRERSDEASPLTLRSAPSSI